MFVLTVQFDEPVGQVLQRAGGGEVAVDEGAAAALGGDFAPDEPLLAADLEDGLDCRCLFASPDEVARCPPAEEQADRFDEDRLAGPGFAAQHVQTRVELDLDRVDDRQTSDREEAKHRREENSNPNIGLTAIFTSCYSFARPQFGALPVALSQRRRADFRRAVCARLEARSSPCCCRRRAVPCPATPAIRQFWA